MERSAEWPRAALAAPPPTGSRGHPRGRRSAPAGRGTARAPRRWARARRRPELGSAVGRLTRWKLRILQLDQGRLVQLDPLASRQPKRAGVETGTYDHDTLVGPSREPGAKQVVDHSVAHDVGCVRVLELAERLEQRPRRGGHEPLGEAVVADGVGSGGIEGSDPATVVRGPRHGLEGIAHECTLCSGSGRGQKLRGKRLALPSRSPVSR